MQAWKFRTHLAVMNALRSLGVKPQETIDLARLRGIWPEYGVRDTDLMDALRQMQAKDLVRVEGPSGSERVTLTRSGDEWSGKQSGAIEYMLLRTRRERSTEAGPARKADRRRQLESSTPGVQPSAD